MSARKPSLATLMARTSRGSRARRPVVDPEVLRELAEVESRYADLEARHETATLALAAKLGVAPPDPSWGLAGRSAFRERFVAALCEAMDAETLDLDDPVFLARERADRERQAIWSRRWDLRAAAGLDPRTGAAPVRQRATNRAGHVGEGWYPDLLGPTEELRRGCDVETIRGRAPVLHTSCSDGRFHHLRYEVDGEVVAGLTLHAGRPWRGLRKATVDRVFTAEGHRRQGYAAALLDYAERYFREVRHSTDLTGAGRLWKRAVSRGRRR